MMPYPADFLPRSIIRPTNKEISLLPNSGSGCAGLLGGTLRLGIFYTLPSSGLGLLGPVLGAGVSSIRNPQRVLGAAPDVVAHAGQVLRAAAADQHHRVLLQVVPDAGDVGGHLDAVDQAHPGHLAQRGVGLLGGHRHDARTDPALLGARLQRRRLVLPAYSLAAPAGPLADRRPSRP